MFNCCPDIKNINCLSTQTAHLLHWRSHLKGSKRQRKNIQWTAEVLFLVSEIKGQDRIGQTGWTRQKGNRNLNTHWLQPRSESLNTQHSKGWSFSSFPSAGRKWLWDFQRPTYHRLHRLLPVGHGPTLQGALPRWLPTWMLTSWDFGVGAGCCWTAHKRHYWFYPCF